VFLQSRGRVRSCSLGKGMRDGSGLAVSKRRHLAVATAGPIGRSLFGGTSITTVDLDTMRVVRTMAMPSRYGEAISLALSPGGDRLAIGTTLGYLLVVDPATGRTILRPTPISKIRWVLPSLIWTRDGRHIFVGGQAGVLYAFNARTFTLEKTIRLTHGEALTGSMAAPDGTYIVVPSENGQVFKIDSATGVEEGRPYSIRGTQLEAAAVSEDGSTVAALGRDGALQLWDSRTGRSLGPALSSHRGFATAIAPAGAHGFVTGGIEQPGIVEWDLTAASWVADACRRVQRNLTAAEWASYVGPGRPRETCTTFR
jgi:outer membrane protein assembly factor BamB